MPKSATLARGGAHLLGMAPLLILLWDIAQSDLGPDPAARVVRDLGYWGLVLLWACLTMTPLRLLFKQAFWVAARRPLGLWSFAYVSQHVSVFAVLWCGLDPVILMEELSERTYIYLGLLGWGLMLPLAITSPRAIRRRKGKNWSRLHRLVYVVSILAILHFTLAAKLDYREPIGFAIFLIFLFFVRKKARQGKAGFIKCAPSA